MAAEDDGKTEDGTAKRKGEARRKGQVTKSQDLNTGGVLLVGILALILFGGRIGTLLQIFIKKIWIEMSNFKLTDETFLALAKESMVLLLYMTLPIMLMILVAGIGINLLQSGWNYTLEPLRPKFAKVFKMEGLKKFKGFSPYIELLKGLAKVSAVGWVAYGVLSKHYEELVMLPDQNIVQMLAQFVDIATELAIKIALLLLLIGIIDFIWQKKKHNDGLKMTKQEVKDEHKNSEGDPKIKAKLRQIQMQIAQRQMMKQVPEATVVVTNPVFLALAIKYERGVDTAPTVLAKGKRQMAERIRELARESEIPVVENKELARGLYDLVEPGDVVPEEFFSAVAELLAYVYGMEGVANG